MQKPCEPSGPEARKEQRSQGIIYTCETDEAWATIASSEIFVALQCTPIFEPNTNGHSRKLREMSKLSIDIKELP